jgi:carboxyl-terminal processing protease
MSRGTKAIVAVVGVLIVFTLGLGIGSGRIDAGSLSRMVKDGGAFRTSQSGQLPEDLSYETVEEIYDALRENYDGELTLEEVIDGIKSGLVEASGDPYTEYLNAEESKEFNDQLKGTFSGVGAELGKNSDGDVIVIAPINDTPAAKAGLRAQDVILEVDGQSTAGQSVSDVASRIRGEAGTEVKLKIARGEGEIIELTITRQEITVPSVKSEVSDGVGVITISRFGDDTGRLTRDAAAAFRDQGVSSVVLDLRGNPGGTVDAAVEVASVWLDKGKVVFQEKRGRKVVKTFKSSGSGELKGVKTVVLIDEGSASASEIVAGALRDNSAATLMGKKSYGKGSVQRVISFKDGSTLKVTIAKWFTPNDDTIDKEGLKPDTEVELSDEDRDAGRDPQLDAAKAAVR